MAGKIHYYKIITIIYQNQFAKEAKSKKKYLEIRKRRENAEYFAQKNLHSYN